MQYSVVYLDPNWKYFVRSDKGKGRSAEHHYPTDAIGKIAAVPVPSLLPRDGHLLMWATYPNLVQAFELISLWNKGLPASKRLRYTTVAFTLVKLNKAWKQTAEREYRRNFASITAFLDDVMKDAFFMGLGHYTRANPEICLLFTKGKPLPRMSRSVRNLVVAPFERHSAKPDEVNRRIDVLFGDVPKVELYARRKYPGWLCLGNEIDGMRLEDSIPAVVNGTYFGSTTKNARVFISNGRKEEVEHS